MQLETRQVHNKTIHKKSEEISFRFFRLILLRKRLSSDSSLLSSWLALGNLCKPAAYENDFYPCDFPTIHPWFFRICSKYHYEHAKAINKPRLWYALPINSLAWVMDFTRSSYIFEFHANNWKIHHNIQIRWHFFCVSALIMLMLKWLEKCESFLFHFLVERI